jgi:heme/copper-type cytochrome/quinol oxidase subunit 2
MIIENNVTFFSIVQLAILLIMLFSYCAWARTTEDERPVPDDELGEKITIESGLVSYKILIVLFFGFICIDYFLHESANLLLIVLFAIALVTLPIIEFMKARSYR